MESTLQIMPVQRISRNFGEYAEEAVIIEEPIIKQKRPLFIEANTIEASLEHLRNDCIIPVFAKDNEATLHRRAVEGMSVGIAQQLRVHPLQQCQRLTVLHHYQLGALEIFRGGCVNARLQNGVQVLLPDRLRAKAADAAALL